VSELEERSEPGLAEGWLACLPLFLVYEAGVAGEATRNTAELLLTRPLALLGAGATPVRWALLAAASALAWHRARSRAEPEEGWRPVVRPPVEGLACALALGPLLVGLLALQSGGVELPALPAGRPAEVPALDRAARLFGGAVWEELLFRVGAVSALWVSASRLVSFLGLGRGIGLALGELVSLVGSALLFAAFHLEGFTAFFGVGGEPFEARAFLWRVLAGLALAGLFRWRGLGTCAWTHGWFNLALFLGAGPGVFQSGS